MKKRLLTCLGLTLSALGFSQAPVTYNFTGAVQTYTVPPCVTSVNIQCFGAQGANAAIGGVGGLGGSATGTLAVNPGDILYIYVGGQNGYNGGGQGGQNGNTVFSGTPSGFAGNGGGASDVRIGGTALTDRVIVAGGGGGAGHNGTWPSCQVAGPAGDGGAGGGSSAGTGGSGVGNPCNCAGGGGAGGQGGTAVAGGNAGAYAGNTACLRSNWAIGQNGILGIGGDGSPVYYNGTGGGGGGGGGYFGGGAGGSGSDTTPGGGGGGGSSYTGTLSSASTTSGTNSGNGSVVITPNSSGSVPSSPSFTSSTTSVCAGSSEVFNISSVMNATNYTWTVPADAVITSGQGTTSMTVMFGSNSGDITVTADNTCGSSAPATLTIAVNALPIVDLGVDITQCAGVAVLDAQNAGSTYSWSSGGSGQTETITSSGTYSVSVTDNNGCTNSDTIDVVIHSLPSVMAEASDSTVCVYSADVSLIGTPANGLWSGPGVSGSVFDPSVGIGDQVLTYTFTDGNGCENSADVIVNVDGCASLAETSLGELINIFPNPTTGTFTVSMNTDLGLVELKVIDLQGRIVFELKENNVKSGYSKEIELFNQANGLYTVQVVTANEVFGIKIQLNK